METPAQTLKRITNTKPEKCSTLGDHWLHPISITDQLVLDGQLRETYSRMADKVKDEKIRDHVMTQAMTIGTIQCALRVGPESDAAPVFSSFEEAYINLNNKPDEAFLVFDAYAKRFDLSNEEKKS